MNTTLIGVTGLAQHGKDTVGRILVEEYGFIRVGFADTLKDLAEEINPIVYVDAEGCGYHLAAFLDPDIAIVTTFDDQPLADLAGSWERAKRLPEVRRFLQELGTRVRKIDPNFWVNALLRLVSHRRDQRVVITDVRFPNEADFVRGWGGELWGVVRINPNFSPYDNGVGLEHESERYVPSLIEQADVKIVAFDVPGIRELVRLNMEREG